MHSAFQGELIISDLMGREVFSRNVVQGRGEQVLRWDPGQLAGGIYLARLNQGPDQQFLKLMYLK